MSEEKEAEKTESKEEKPAKKSSWFTRMLIYLLLIIVIASTAFYFISGLTKSEGEQAGVLLGFAQKGTIFKTYEGEMRRNLGDTPGSISTYEILEFSVNEQAIADSLMEYTGQKVSIHYKEVIHSFFWQGETNFIVDRVRLLEQ